MVYYCIRCGYGTIHKNYMKVHYNSEKICPMDIFIFLTKDEQYELSIIPYKEKKYKRDMIIENLKMGPMSIEEYLKNMEREYKYQMYIKEEEKKKIKKIHQCLRCGNTFYDKSGLNRHQYYQRCKALYLEEKFKDIKKKEDEEQLSSSFIEEDIFPLDTDTMCLSGIHLEESREEDEYNDELEKVNTYQVRFDISHMTDKKRIEKIFSKSHCFYPLFEWFYENPRNWNVYIENEKIEWVIIYDQSNLLDKKLRIMNFDIFLEELMDKIHVNIHLFMEKLKRDISMKKMFEMFKLLKEEEDEFHTNIIAKQEFIQKIKNNMIQNRQKLISLFHKSVQDYQIYSF